MLQTILESVLSLKWYIVIVIAATMLVGGLLMLAQSKMNLSSASVKVLGMFFDMTDMGAMALAASWLRLLFVIYMLAFRKTLDGINAVCLCSFVAMQAAATKKLQIILQQVLNTALTAGAFLALEILVSYMRDVEMDWQMVLIAALLALFILLYSIYFFVKDAAVYGDCGWKKVYELTKKEQ